MSVTINYSAIARLTGRSRQHIRECLVGNRRPGETLRVELLRLGAIKRRRHAKA